MEFERVFITFSISKDVNRQTNMWETNKKKKKDITFSCSVTSIPQVFKTFSSDLISKEYLEITQVIWHCISGCSI